LDETISDDLWVLGDEVEQPRSLISGSHYGMRENSIMIIVRRMEIAIEQNHHAVYHLGFDGHFDNGTMSEKLNNWNGIQDA
jgi:hypothetical protein